jgi:hypothetical protein
MAIRFARQAGNWSDPLTWDDGLTIPTTGDEVYLNNYNITINQDVTTGFIANSVTPIGVPLDPIPDMTSNTSPIGVGQAFATQNNLIAWQAFRKGISNFSVSADINLGWRSGVNNIGQLGFQFDSAKIIKRYSFYSSMQSSGQRPRDWTFEGSNDGITWTILHTVAGYSNTPIYSSPVINNTTSYTHYRINVTATISSQQVHLHSFTMTESTSLGNGYLSGGTATISTSRTVNADLFHASGTLITISATSPSVVNITGNMPGTVAASSSNGINCTGNATLNYVGDIQASTSSFSNSPTGIRLAIGSTLNLTGNIVGGLNSANFGTQASPIGVRSNINAIINVVGNVTGGPSGIFNYGILQATGDNVTITGLVSGGFGSTGGQYNAGVFGGGLSLTIFGNLIGGNNAPAIWSGGVAVRMYGNIQNASNGFAAVLGVAFFFVESTTQYEFRKLDLTTNTLYTPGVATGHPATNNVRTGITYGPTNNLTGTCAVPPAAAVSIGVPVDNTVGTGYLNATDIWNVPLASITTPNSIGERLKDASTVQSTGAQLAAFLP